MSARVGFTASDAERGAAMKPPALEIKLILSAPGMGWEYVARYCGEVIAASDGDAPFGRVGEALHACSAEINAWVSAKVGGDGE